MARPTKDEQIIKQNPNASPYDLLMKGVSQEKYNELVAAEEAKNKTQAAEPQKAKPVVTRIVAAPITTATAPIVSSPSDMAWLIDKSGKTRPFYMNKTQALRQVKKYPTEFEIR